MISRALMTTRMRKRARMTATRMRKRQRNTVEEKEDEEEEEHITNKRERRLFAKEYRRINAYALSGRKGREELVKTRASCKLMTLFHFCETVCDDSLFSPPLCESRGLFRGVGGPIHRNCKVKTGFVV